ncbi:MAG TPA: hypothetical protein VHZ32_14010 [Rhizomicrobium sp.]|jgi:hypothetical protein|nr:hypothetical protein [Rhizomicrobium sp.]
MRKALAILLLVFPPLPALAQVQGAATPPSLNVQTGTSSPTASDAIYCRPPQELPGQRLYGPRVCKPQSQWDDLHRQGMDIGPDGESVVASEKYRTFHGCSSGPAC